jgi:nucleotide-binding universal stress UspA family protein
LVNREIFLPIASHATASHSFEERYTEVMNFQTILVPVDFSDVTAKVVQTAGEMAKAFRSKAVLLHVSEPDPDFVGFEPGPPSVRTVVARDFKAEHQKLSEWKAVLAGMGVETTALHIQGPLADKVLLEADAQGAGLIVMGSHGHGALYNLLVGSVTSGVLKGAKCPVLVVPADRITGSPPPHAPAAS